MKVLIINNASIVKKNDSFFIFRSDEVSSYLKSKGHDIEFFQFGTVANSNIHTFNLIENGFNVTTVNIFRIKIFSYLIAYIVGMWRVIFNDFIYIYYPNNFKFLALFAKLIGKDYGLYLRGSLGINSRLSKFLYKHSLVVFCVSPILTKMVVDYGGLGLDKKPTIPFCYEDIVFDRVYIKKDKYNILYLGRTDKDKGLFELIDAVKKLISMQFKFKVDIVGDGNVLEQLKNKVNENGVGDVITFHGAIMEKDMIKNFYLNADIYIFPTYHEGFPRTLCEAMIFGTPVITTFVGGIPGFMKEDFNSIKIDTKSVDSIVEKLTYGLKNYEELSKIAQKATETVAAMIDPKIPTHAEQLNKILEGIIKC